MFANIEFDLRPARPRGGRDAGDRRAVRGGIGGRDGVLAQITASAAELQRTVADTRALIGRVDGSVDEVSSSTIPELNASLVAVQRAAELARRLGLRHPPRSARNAGPAERPRSGDTAMIRESRLHPAPSCWPARPAAAACSAAAAAAELYRFGSAPPRRRQRRRRRRGQSILVSYPGADFEAESRGDRILTVTGASASYVADARWVAPAADCSTARWCASIDRLSPAIRIVRPGDVPRPDFTLAVDVRRFEAAYLGAEAPEALVEANVRLIRRSDRTIVGEWPVAAASPPTPTA